MQQYKYTAVDLQKKKYTGTFIANDEKDLAAQLMKQNLFLVSCSAYSGGTPSAFFTMGTGKVKMSELTTFCRQFSIMLNAGISVLEGLDLLRNQPFTAFFKSLLNVIYDDIKSGIMMSEALNKHEKVFPEFMRSMVYVGEVSGKLDLVFNSLADYYERDSEVKKKTKSAFSYPIMLVFLTIAIVILMLAYVVPTFKETLAGLDVAPTGIAKAVYAVSDFLTANWLYMLAIVVVIGVTLFLVGRTKKGSYFYDVVKLKLPFFKRVSIDLITSRFARGFALLLSSGMEIADALDAIVIVLGNQDIERRFKLAAEEVKHGSKMSVAFQKHNIFPSLMIQMIAIGEKTAALEEVLNRSRKFFDDQVETSINSVLSKVQPIILIIMGAVVGTLFLAVYSPMISIMTTL